MRNVFVVTSLFCSVLAAHQPKVQNEDAGRHFGPIGGLMGKIFGVDIPNSYKLLTSSAIGDQASQYPVTAIISASVVALPNYVPGSRNQPQAPNWSTYAGGSSSYGFGGYRLSPYVTSGYRSTGEESLPYQRAFNSAKQTGSRSNHCKHAARSFQPYNPDQQIDYTKVNYYEFRVKYFSDNNGGWFGTNSGLTYTCSVAFVGYQDFLGNTAVDSNSNTISCQPYSYGSMNQG